MTDRHRTSQRGSSGFHGTQVKQTGPYHADQRDFHELAKSGNLLAVMGFPFI